MTGKPRILHVDDSDAIRYSVAATLRHAGFEMLEAATGEDALLLARREKPDLILLDVRLPDIQGWEVCRILKSDPSTARILIIHLSASLVGELHRVQGLEHGADGYLTEPISQAELLANVRAFMRIRDADLRQQFLSDASAALASTLDVEEALRQIAWLAVPFLGDVCIVDRVEPEGVRPVAVVQADPKRELALDEWVRRFPLEPYLQHGVAHVIRTRSAELHPQGPQAAPPLLDARHPASLRSLGARSYLCVPLIGRDRVLGVITLASTGASACYGTTELALAQQLAHRAAISVDNARLFEQAQRAIQSRESLLALVSHDLKNPLATISASAALLRRRATGGQDTLPLKQIDAILRATAQMDRLIHDLLDLASIEAGRLAIERGPIELRSLFDELLESVRPRALDKGVQLEVRGAEIEVGVCCDRGRILQVLANLVDNAIKFTPPGGRVSITVGRDDHSVTIEVADTGAGISEEQMPHIFERFWQAPNASRLGTGLGLSIAKGIVEAHGGRIRATSRVGHGSVFSIRLPLGSEQPEQPFEPTPPPL